MVSIRPRQAGAAGPAVEGSKEYTIHTDNLFDSYKKAFVSNISVTVDKSSGLIKKVFERSDSIQNSMRIGDVNLGGLFIMPGFVDAHAHIFLHPYTERSSLEQERDESLVERVIRSTNHTRVALLAGYTTYRDLGTEGVQTADTNVRDAINRGIIPGPRLFVATDPISSTGTYDMRGENRLGGTILPNLTDAADGVDGCRQAVRRRLGLGADLIKVYGDYRRRALRFPPNGTPIKFLPGDVNKSNPSIQAYTMEEMIALADEAKRGQCAIAAHCQTNEAAAMAAKAGFTSVEHSPILSEDTLLAFKENNTIFVPTLSVWADPSAAFQYKEVAALTKKAYDMGIQLACGGDTGGFPAHGESALELELIIEAGVPVEEVMSACMLGGWKACGGDLTGYRFGYLGEGWCADIVGLASDPRKDKKAFRNVDFVMKDAKIWKSGGNAVGMI